MSDIKVTSAFVTKSFNKLRKKKNASLTIVSCSKSESRTSCTKANGRIHIKNGLFNKGVFHSVFVKFSRCRWWDFDEYRTTHGISETTAKEAPTYAEVKFFALTNALNEHKVCDSFPFSYNHLLNEHIVKHDKKQVREYSLDDDGIAVYDRTKPYVKKNEEWHPYYSMLITENLSGYEELGTFLKSSPDKMTDYDHYAILFQIMYAIQCMGEINMGHMDLHGGNVLVKKLNLVKNYTKYTYKTPSGGFKTVFIPITYEVKIIDLDGAYKFRSNDTIKQEFTPAIVNKNVYTGDNVVDPNPRHNTIKVLYTYNDRMPESFLKPVQHNIIRRMLRKFFTNKTYRVPFVNYDPSKYNSKGDRKLVKHFGIFLNENTRRGSNLKDDIIMHPGYIVDRIAKKFTKVPSEEYVAKELSQEGLFKKKATPYFTPKPEKPKTPPSSKPKPVKPKTPPSPKPKPVKQKTKPKQNSPDLLSILFTSLQKDVKNKCGSPKAGRPKPECSDALKKLKVTCKEYGRVLDKRVCRKKKTTKKTVKKVRV